MRGLVAILYFFLCGYAFAKYGGDDLLVQAGRKLLREIVTEAHTVTRQLEAQPAVVIDLTAMGMPGWTYTPATPGPAAWWEAQQVG